MNDDIVMEVKDLKKYFPIKAGMFGNQQQVEQDIGTLVAQGFATLGRIDQGSDLGIGFPLRQFKQLGGFEIQRSNQIAQGMKLTPVAFISELDQGFGKLLQFAHGNGRGLCGMRG